MTKLILIRHGETLINTKGILHDYNDPEVLTAKGIKQAGLTGTKLKEIEIEKLFSSKELRAKQTAEIIGEICKTNVIDIEGLEERNWGKFSGKPWSEIKAILDQMSLEERYNYVPPEGESWKAFETRLINTVKNIIKQNSDKNIAVTTHGGSIRALIPYLLNIPKEESFKYDPSNASISVFEFSENIITPIVINDTSHLDI